jgi:peptidase YpeB-like protein
MGNMPISKVFGASFSKSGLAAVALIASLAAAPIAMADDDQAEDAKEAAAVAGAKLTLSQAIEAAQKEVPDAKVIKAEVDTENGVPSYVVELGNQRLVFDLSTGQMTKVAAAKDDDGGNDDSANREDEDEDEDDE